MVDLNSEIDGARSLRASQVPKVTFFPGPNMTKVTLLRGLDDALCVITKVI